MVNKVRVNIAGTPYAIATTDSEKYIQTLAKKLDEDITKLLDGNENLSVTKAAVFCAMDYLDEYRKSTGSAENMAARSRTTSLTQPGQSWPRTRPRPRTRCCAGKPPPCGSSWKRCAIRRPAGKNGPPSRPQPKRKQTRRSEPFTG